MNSRNWAVSVVVAICLLFTQSCATVTKSIPKDEFRKIPSIRLVRSASPDLLKPTAGSQAIALTGVFFGAIGGGIGELGDVVD
jgi:hypothetical protein